MIENANPALYLQRMAASSPDKMKITAHISNEVKNVLDVGCADGSFTIALAIKHPDVQFCGIDRDSDFIKLAKVKAKELGLKNVRFKCIFLRDLLKRRQRYDVVIFCSVLHEFFTYGEGRSSVMKALADAHELLHKGGVVVVRDMIMNEYTKKSHLHVQSILEKIQKSEYAKLLHSFEKRYGEVTTLYTLNHYLLKYPYGDNWKHELSENYVAITFQDYLTAFEWLGMEVSYQTCYLIPFLKDKWQHDFGLTDLECEPLKSTGILIAQK